MAVTSTSFQEIIKHFPDRQAIANGLNLPYQTVSSWNRRNYIPPAYWPGLVDLATILHLRRVKLADLRRLGDEHDAARLDRVEERRLSLLAEHIARRG